jgi:predicted transcriptional regulator
MPLAEPLYLEALLREIWLAHRVQYPASLNELATWAGCDYETANRGVCRLEQRGLVKVENRGQRPKRLKIIPQGNPP